MESLTKKISKIGYVFSIIMVVCTSIVAYRSNLYIGNLIKEGLSLKKELIEVINYYISTIVPFLFYTVALFLLAYIIGTNKTKDENVIKNIKEKTRLQDAEIEELFESIDN